MKRIWRPLAGAAFVALLLATPARAGFETPAAPPGYENVSFRYNVERGQKLTLKYDVYAGGFRALNARFKMDLDKKAYDLLLEAQTQGFIGSLFPWKASINTAGVANDKGMLIPSTHTERSSWRKSESITEMSYGPDGRILKTTTQDNGKTTTDRDIDESASAHAVDILTGALIMLQNAKNTQSCAGVFPVFDGKRRFNITLQDNGKETLAPSEYSRFAGEAMRCTLKVEPVAGFKKKDQNRGWMAVQNHTEERHKLPTLWLARLKDGGQVVPVRMEIASAYGAVVAHLTGRAYE